MSPKLSVVVKRACRDTLQYTVLLMLTLYSLSMLVSLTSHFSDGVSSCSFNPVYAGYLYHQCSSKSPWRDFQTTAAKRILASSSPLLSPHLSFPPPLSFCAPLHPPLSPSLLSRASVYRRVLEPGGVWWCVCVYSVSLQLEKHQYDTSVLSLFLSCTTFLALFSRGCFRTVAIFA